MPTEADRGWFQEQAVALLPDLLAAALRLEKNPTDAEDLVAEALERAWRGLDGLDDRNRFRGWIFRILTNRFISACRARAGRPPLEPLGEAAEAESFSLFEKVHQPFLLWWGNPEQELLDRLLREDLERAVDALPECYRVVVVLADLQGFTYAEIAGTLELPVGTVRSRLSRGRSLLQEALWRHAQDAGLVGGVAAHPVRAR